MPPRKRTTNAARYKQLIKACVPHKRNDELHATHADRQFCEAQVKMAMEFSARHSHRFQMVSADDMNKVNIGVPAVSRYHQLRRFFAVADGPNMPDHDFPVTK